jgi:Protein of unknown function (DUF3224)
MKHSLFFPWLIWIVLISLLQSVPAQTSNALKGTTMSAAGEFEVKLIPQDDKLNNGISRILLDKHYHGELEGDSSGQMLAAGSAKTTGVYVAIETFTGSIRGRTGGFSLYHTGVTTKGGPELAIKVVPGSGTGQLTDITGSMNIKIAADGKHSYDFEYMLPDR